MMRRALHGLVCAGALWAVCVQAQERDPTRPPPEMNVAPAAGTAAAAAAARAQDPFAGQGMTVLVRDGKPYLVSATRLYGVGALMGQYKIDRITETEVWLRDGKELLKFPRFAGIQRRAAATERPTP